MMRDINNTEAACNTNMKCFFAQVFLLAGFVITFFIIVAIYTYVFARVQNSTPFFKLLDVIHFHFLSQLLSLAWLVSLPILLVIYYLLFFKILFKKYFFI